MRSRHVIRFEDRSAAIGRADLFAKHIHLGEDALRRFHTGFETIATGRLFRAIVIRLPRSTRSINREKCAFVSAILETGPFIKTSLL